MQTINNNGWLAWISTAKMNTKLSLVGILVLYQRHVQGKGSCQEMKVLSMVDRNLLYQGLTFYFFSEVLIKFSLVVEYSSSKSHTSVFMCFSMVCITQL